MQNVYLWALPNKKEKARTIPGEGLIMYEVVQPLDGIFGYDVWIRYKCSRDSLISVHSNGATLLQNANIESKSQFSWIYCGTTSYAKGMQSLRIFNRSKEPFEIDGVVLTYDKQYISSGHADEDKQLLDAGQAPILKEAKHLMGEETDKRKKDENMKKLYRSGFVERPAQATYTTDCRNGVPMGGIGAGKIELDSDGVFTGITINNNFDVPLYKTEGSFFAIRWDGGAKILQKANYNSFNFPTIEDIEFEGIFPSARLCYRDRELPVKLSLNAFSPLIPNNVKDSILPCAVFEFEVENPGDADREVSLMFSWENMIGTGGSMVVKSQNPDVPTINVMNTWNPGFTWSDRTGTYQNAVSNSELGFYSKYHNQNPTSFGNYTILTDSTVNATCRESWNVFSQGENLWDEFLSRGEFAVNSPSQFGTEEKDYLAGALCRKILLGPGEKKKVAFVLSWYMPHLIDRQGKDLGTYYTNFFENSSEIAHYVMENRESLLNKTMEIWGLLEKSSLPPWLSRKLINDMFPIITDSWFSKQGEFAINEAPTGMMGCLGTMDQRLACNVIYTNFFKELDKNELDLFARCQGRDGSISHDLGAGTFDINERGGSWSDLASSFVLQVYKHYLYTGDRGFFEAMYPRVKRAVEWQKTIDYDNDGIPNVGAGNGTTYDTYHWFGTSSFVASLWLAELKACMHMADMSNDTLFKEECESSYKRAQKSMIDELWTDRYDFGGYFRNYYDALGNRSSENCFIAQLAGQWFAQLMDLGFILPEDKVREAIKTITKQNVKLEGLPGMNDETTPKGEFDWFGYTFVQYDETYYGCLAIYNGFIEEGLECFRRVHEMTKRSPWNIALTHHADGRIIGLPYYMTNPASFFILEALSGYVPDVVNSRMKLSPNIGNRDTLSVPLFSPALWIWLDYTSTLNKVTYRVKVLKVIDREDIKFEHQALGVPAGKTIKSITINGRAESFRLNGETVEIDYPAVLKQGTEFTVEIVIE